MRNWIKCNTDGSWHQQRNNSGVGWICRNEEGNMLWAGAKAVTRLSSSIETEAEALKWTVEMMVSLGYTNIIFETDSLTVAKLLNGEERMWPRLQPTIESIQQSLSLIRHHVVKYNPREENMAAARIAKETFTFMSNVPKLYYVVPKWLKSHVEAEKPLYEETVG